VRLNGGRLTANNDDIVELFLAFAAGAVSREHVEYMFTRWVATA
jgi:prophage maintenance system killer protein